MTTRVDDSAIRTQWIDPEGRSAPELPDYDSDWLRDILRHMVRARCVDERMLLLQRSGRRTGR